MIDRRNESAAAELKQLNVDVTINAIDPGGYERKYFFDYAT